MNEIDIAIPPNYEMIRIVTKHFDVPEIIEFLSQEQLEDAYAEIIYYRYI